MINNSEKLIIYIGNCQPERFVDVYFILEISTSNWSVLEEKNHLYRKLPAREIRWCLFYFGNLSKLLIGSWRNESFILETASPRVSLMFISFWKFQQAIDQFLKKWIIYIGNCHPERFVDVYFVLEISTSYWSILEEIAGLRDLSMSLEAMIHLYRKLPARGIRRCRLEPERFVAG